MLSIQAIAVACFVIWSLIASITIVSVTNLMTPLRMTPENELLGADLVVHEISYDNMEPLHLVENCKVMNESFETLHNGERPKMILN